jgi:hypothetical protein
VAPNKSQAVCARIRIRTSASVSSRVLLAHRRRHRRCVGGDLHREVLRGPLGQARPHASSGRSGHRTCFLATLAALAHASVRVPPLRRHATTLRVSKIVLAMITTRLTQTSAQSSCDMNLLMSTLPSIQQACCLANAAPGDLNAGAAEGPSCGLIMTARWGWLVGAGHPDPSLTRFSDVKTFNGLFLYKAGT